MAKLPTKRHEMAMVTLLIQIGHCPPSSVYNNTWRQFGIRIGSDQLGGSVNTARQTIIARTRPGVASEFGPTIPNQSLDFFGIFTLLQRVGECQLCFDQAVSRARAIWAPFTS